MGELLAIAFIGGFITGVSPCIVPVLPVVVAGGSTGSRRARPFLIIAGLVLSFSLAELLGTTLLSALGLPEDFLFWLGISVLLVLALGLMVPTIGYWTERPFSRLGASRHAGSGGGFVLGLSLGLVFVPCAGPVLAAISVAAANHRVNASSLFVTLFYAAGAALPLLVLSVAAQRAANGWQSFRKHLPAVRRIAGAVLALTTVAIAVGLFDPLQRAVPGYTSALENRVEGSSSISSQLQKLSGEHANSYAKKQADARAVTVKELCGRQTIGSFQSASVAGPWRGGELHWHRGLAQHAGRPTPLLGPIEGEGGAGRLLDLLLHQLPAFLTPRRSLVQRLQEVWVRGGGGTHARVRLRARPRQRSQCYA